jgi:heme A synthase
LAAGVDVYILNYLGLFTNGPTLCLGTVNLDPRFGSHVPSDSFSAMWEDIEAGLAHIRAQSQYQQILQYSHSTGALIMATYPVVHLVIDTGNHDVFM